MTFKPILLATDFLWFVLLGLLALVIWRICRSNEARKPWLHVFSNGFALSASLVLATYALIATLDSIHYQPCETHQSQTVCQTRVYSVLDSVLAPLNKPMEISYSKPFATHLKSQSLHAPLKITSAWSSYISFEKRLKYDLLFAFVTAMAICFLLSLFFAKHLRFKKAGIFWLTLFTIIITLTFMYVLSRHFHILGTGKVGQDIFYQTIKSIRTGLFIGTLTTLVMLPFALVLGILAGYRGGIYDDIIQYVYTTLSSIPAVLLIAAMVLSLQVYIANHPNLFTTLDSRADLRLLILCAILGLMSWTTLCRLLRAEVLKLRESDFLLAARALGSRTITIMYRHLLPNVMHIVLITVVLDFSGLVLAEAVLSYVGVGVSPTMNSWGNMINSARLQLAREPVVWWPILSAFSFMFILVLAANLFADSVRDAFDPRTRQIKKT